MTLYKREDNAVCEAEQFLGEAEGMDHVLDLIAELDRHGVEATWEPERSTDEWVETEAGEIVEVIIPEHLRIIAPKDEDNEDEDAEAYVGDYLVKRDGTIYVSGKDLFESIYTEVVIRSIDVRNN